MKKKVFSSLGGKLLPYLPGYQNNGALILAQPVGHILRGIGFDSSGHDAKAFHVHVFFQPLCVPAEHTHWTLGFRLRNMNNLDGWYSDRPDVVADIGKAIIAKALPFLDSVATLEGAARAAELIGSSNSHVSEAAAYCWALAGNTRRAMFRLENLCNWLNRCVDRRIGWQVEQLERVEYLRKLLREDPSAARKQLLVWEADTAQRIGSGMAGSKPLA